LGDAQNFIHGSRLSKSMRGPSRPRR
jgi:hypothetical protein